MNNKFIDIRGQVVKRIVNPERMSKAGKPYQINYLVLKWTTGPNGEYTDYVPIKLMEAKRMADIRAGYVVELTVQYGCKNMGKEPEYRNNSYGGVTTVEPRLFPEFSLTKSSDILVIDDSENWEQNTDTNTSFKQEVLDNAPPPPAKDDLPF